MDIDSIQVFRIELLGDKEPFVFDGEYAFWGTREQAEEAARRTFEVFRKINPKYVHWQILEGNEDI